MSMIANPQFVQRDGGDFQRKQFQIAASQEAFRILSDGLYSRKIDAVIRELSTNALDSHIVCGKEEPFEVHLPSMSEPWFSVKDYGTGLSHEDVMELYSTYFGTNKAEDISTTGCLGLGSKSPLAKVRSFSVISRYGGVERHYIVALNEDRIPEVNYLPEQDSATTVTGMEIKLAVSASDIYEYINRASAIYRYFPEHCRPRVLNCANYSISTSKAMIEGNGWRIYKESGNPIAIQGNVAYPIVASHIKGIETRHEHILSCNVEIDFPNGSLSFTPSREHLSYNKMTTDALLQRLDEIVEEVNERIAKRFENCRSLWEARTLASSMFWSDGAYLRKLRKLADTSNLVWQGKKIAGQRLSFDDIDGVHGHSFEIAKRRKSYWSNTYSIRVVRRERKEYVPKTNALWIESDIPRGVYSRCDTYIRDNEDTTIYLVSFDDASAKQAFCDKMGLLGDEFIQVSTLPKPVSNYVKGNRIHRSTSLVYRHKHISNAERLHKYWEPTEVDLDSENGGVYVEMKHNKVVDASSKCIDPSIITTVVNLVENATEEHIDVIGVRPQVAKKFHKSDDWVDLWTYVKNLIRIHINKHNLANNVVNTEALLGMKDYKLWESITALQNVNSSKRFHDFVGVMTKMTQYYTACNGYKAWRELCTLLSVSLDAKPKHDLDRLVIGMCSEFPMISVLICAKRRMYDDNRFTPEELEAIRHYLGLTSVKTVL
jgi:hypothetical protein